jgi:hypothetical protein
MSPSLSIAANLSSVVRQRLAIEVLAMKKPVSDLAAEHQVSRKFVYRQVNKAEVALSECFEPSIPDDRVMLGLILICRSSYRGVVELFRDLFDLATSVGTIHNRLESAAVTAKEINAAQDLSGIKVGLHDEIFQGSQPVLTGVDAASTYCYLLIVIYWMVWSIATNRPGAGIYWIR